MILGQTGDERAIRLEFLIEEPVPLDLQCALRSRVDIKHGVYAYRAILIDAHRALAEIWAYGPVRAIIPTPLV